MIVITAFFAHNQHYIVQFPRMLFGYFLLRSYIGHWHAFDVSIVDAASAAESLVASRQRRPAVDGGRRVAAWLRQPGVDGRVWPVGRRPREHDVLVLRERRPGDGRLSDRAGLAQDGRDSGAVASRQLVGAVPDAREAHGRVEVVVDEQRQQHVHDELPGGHPVDARADGALRVDLLHLNRPEDPQRHVPA